MLLRHFYWIMTEVPLTLDFQASILFSIDSIIRVIEKFFIVRCRV